MSQTEQTKTPLKFILRFTLINFIWIAPLVALCLHSTVLKIIFFSFLVSYTFLSWLKYFGTKLVILQKVSVIIKFLYYLSVLIFLGLTGVATYEGIVNLFGLVGWNQVFAVVFAIGIAIGLFVITLFIKERKTPSLIFGALVLYILFDSMTALPYNFLFFYEHLKVAANVEYDKKNLSVVVDACDSIIIPRYDSAVHNLTSISSKMNNAVSDAEANNERKLKHDQQQLDDQLNKGTITQEQYNQSYNWLMIKYRPKEIKKSKNDNNVFNSSFADSIRYQKLLNDLLICKDMKLILDNTTNTDSASQLSNRIKMNLIPICNSDTSLKGFVQQLYPKKPSALQSIKQLYRFIGNKIIGKNDVKLVEENEKRYDEDTDMLIMMSLSSSIVIDILPLLLSLLYAKFKRDD